MPLETKAVQTWEFCAHGPVGRWSTFWGWKADRERLGVAGAQWRFQRVRERHPGEPAELGLLEPWWPSCHRPWSRSVVCTRPALGDPIWW